MKNNTRKQNAGVVRSFLISTMPLQAMVKQHEQLIDPWEKWNNQVKQFSMPWWKMRQYFKNKAPLWVCELAIAAAEDNDIETLDLFAQKYLKLKPDEWPYVEETLREALKNWRIAEEPLHYIESIAHKKKQWGMLDIDRRSYGEKIYGSLYRKKKKSWNREPRNIISLDAMNADTLERENRRHEGDRELWLDNEGILENDPQGYRIAGEHKSKYDISDPDSMIRGSNNNEDDSIAKIDIEIAVKRAGLQGDDVKVALAWGLRPYKRFYHGSIRNQYKPGWEHVHMTAPDIATFLRWDEKRVNASMKRIKRAVKNNKLYY
jgi:hypothetical protein